MGLFDFLKGKKERELETKASNGSGMPRLKKLDFTKITTKPVRLFSYGNNPAMFLKDVPVKDGLLGETVQQVFLVMSMSPIANSKDPGYVSYPLMWVTAQKIGDNSEHFLVINASYPSGPQETVLSDPSDRLVTDDEYFVREAMVCVFQLMRTSRAPFKEIEQHNDKIVATYTISEREGRYSMSVSNS